MLSQVEAIYSVKFFSPYSPTVQSSLETFKYLQARSLTQESSLQTRVDWEKLMVGGGGGGIGGVRGNLPRTR